MAFRSVPRPSSPPGAKASTECPSYARSPDPTLSGRTLNPPCTGTIHTQPRSSSPPRSRQTPHSASRTHTQHYTHRTGRIAPPDPNAPEHSAAHAGSQPRDRPRPHKDMPAARPLAGQTSHARRAQRRTRTRFTLTKTTSTPRHRRTPHRHHPAHPQPNLAAGFSETRPG